MSINLSRLRRRLATYSIFLLTGLTMSLGADYESRKPKMDFHAYVIGDESEKVETNAMVQSSPTFQSPQSLQIQSSTDEFGQKVTDISVNKHINAEKLVGFFDPSLETSLEFSDLSDRDNAPVNLWQTFISNIKSLNHLYAVRNSSSLSLKGLTLLAEYLNVHDLISVHYPSECLETWKVGEVVGQLNKIFKKTPHIQRIILPYLSTFDEKHSCSVVLNLIKDLSPLSQLRVLDLRQGYMDDEGLKILSTFLANSPLMEEISLSYEGKALICLADMLRNLKNLKKLSLFLGDNDCQKALAEILGHPILENFTFLGGETSLTKEGYEHIGECVGNAPQLKKIFLQSLLTSGYAGDFFKGWGGKGNLEGLDVYDSGSVFGSKMSDEVTQLLATCIMNSRALSYLNLKSANITEEGAKMLATALEKRGKFCALEVDFFSDVVEIFIPLAIKGQISIQN